MSVIDKLATLVEQLYVESENYTENPSDVQLWYNRGYANGIVSYEVAGQQGVPVESEQFDKQDVRIVLIPNPARFVMLINGRQLKDLWRSR